MKLDLDIDEYTTSHLVTTLMAENQRLKKELERARAALKSRIHSKYKNAWTPERRAAQSEMMKERYESFSNGGGKKG